MAATDLAAETFQSLPINEASEGARCLRYLEPQKLKEGQPVLSVGHTWNPDVDTWPQNIRFLRKNEKEKDPDEFKAVKRLTDNLIKVAKLAKTVSVRNLTSMTSIEKTTVIHCMWPSPDRGYKAKHLLSAGRPSRKLTITIAMVLFAKHH